MKIVLDLREMTFQMEGMKAQIWVLVQCTERKGMIVCHGGKDTYDVGKIWMPIEDTIDQVLASLQILADAQKKIGNIKVGEEVQVSNNDAGEAWFPHKLLAILPENIGYRYICDSSDYPDRFSSWQHCRPVVKRASVILRNVVQTQTYKHCIVTITDEEDLQMKKE